MRQLAARRERFRNAATNFSARFHSFDDEHNFQCHYGQNRQKAGRVSLRRFLALAGVLALPFAVAPAQAHHSMAMFDQTKIVSMTGTVRAFQWTNPHCYIQLMVKDAAGKDVEWSLEMGAPMYLYAAGWRPSTLKAGTAITVTVNPLKDGKPGAVVVTATMADGKPIGKGVPLSKAAS